MNPPATRGWAASSPVGRACRVSQVDKIGDRPTSRLALAALGRAAASIPGMPEQPEHDPGLGLGIRLARIDRGADLDAALARGDRAPQLPMQYQLEQFDAVAVACRDLL